MTAPVRAAAATILLVALLFPATTWALPTSCYCVKAIRDLGGINIPFGDADTQRPNRPLHEMTEGDILLMRYEKVYHVAIVVGFSGEVNRGIYLAPEKIIIRDWNFIPCTETVRSIDFDSSNIWGVYSPNKSS